MRLGAPQAGRRVGHVATPLEPLRGCPGVQGQGVESGIEFAPEQGIDSAVPGEKTCPQEVIADDGDLEMGFGTRGDAVHVTLVHQFQMQGGKVVP